MINEKKMIEEIYGRYSDNIFLANTLRDKNRVLKHALTALSKQILKEKKKKQERNIKVSKIKIVLLYVFERYKDKEHNWIDSAIKQIANDLNIKIELN